MSKPIMWCLSALLVGFCTGIIAYPGAIWAQPFRADAPKHDYQIPPGPLASVLGRFALAAGITLSYDARLTVGKRSEGIQGLFTPTEALTHLLAEQNLEAVLTSEGIYLLRSRQPELPSNLMPMLKVTAFTEGDQLAGYVAHRSTTATKTATSLVEIPQSITVLNAARIDGIGEVHLKDVLAYTPGVGSSPFGADSRYDWISVRGFDAYVPGFYLDGLPMQNIGNMAVWRTENYGAERIEILRGPSSVLYGLGNPGGVVNIVSKLPTAETVREFKVQAGSHDRRKVAGDFSGALNEDATLLYRVTFLARDAELPAGHMPDDRYYFAPSLTWAPSAETKWTLMAQYGQTRAGVFANAVPVYGSLLPTAAGTRIDPKKFIGDPDFNHFNQQQSLIGYQVEHRVDDTWTVRQKARVSQIHLDTRRLFTDRYVTQNANPADPENYRYLSFTPFYKREKVESFVVDNQLQADFELGQWVHTLLVGLSHQRMTVDQLMRYGGSLVPMDTYASSYDSAAVLSATPTQDGYTSLTQTGLYIQDQINRDRWRFLLGGRFDDTMNRTTNRLAGGSQTYFHDSKFTGRAGLVYLFPNGWSPYLSYSESFAPVETSNPVSNTAFKSETARQYEAGLRYQSPDGRSLYSAAVFDLRRQNYLNYDATGIPRQTGDFSIRGLELEAMTSFLPGSNLIASYSYTPHAKVIASFNPAELGTQPTAVPVNRASMWMDYRFENGLKLGAGLRYEGSTRGNGNGVPVRIPAYTLLDALAGFSVGQWNISLNILNLADKIYIANCISIACYYGSPRLILATATYRW